ncbi:MAG: DGQHR domain-containing protein [Christensenellales bacterium]
MSTIIKQDCNCKIIHDVKSVDWLAENTKVKTFNKFNFTGYQRKVNEDHVLKIVKYLEKEDFYLPTSIICSSNEVVNEDTVLNIVDGQHRVEAFKRLKENNVKRYLEIKDYQVSVIILEEPSEELEVDTFITINKTSRKVDTSLAYVLKNKININKIGSLDLTSAKAEFLAVELAININMDENSLWHNRILLEGNPTKNSYETISLNAFVRTTRLLIGYLDKYKVISLEWKDENEFKEALGNTKNVYLYLWRIIRDRWPNIFISKEEVNLTVLQGTIGVSSINKYIIKQLTLLEDKEVNLDTIMWLLDKWIKKVDVPEESWYKGEGFSKFSSESGYNLVAQMLMHSYEN